MGLLLFFLGMSLYAGYLLTKQYNSEHDKLDKED